MGVLASLCSHLKNNAGVSGQVGTKIYIDRAPPDRPTKFIVVTMLSADHEHDQSGVSGKVRHGFQVNCFSASGTDSATIAEQVRLSVDGMTNGTLGTAPNDMTVTSVFIESERTLVYERDEASADDVHGVLMTLTIWSVESDPAV